MERKFGNYLKTCREKLRKNDKKYSLRQVAARAGIQPSYLSKLERGEQTYLSEEKTVSLARELGEEPDLLLGLNGKISKDVQEIIIKRPELYTQLIRELKNLPEHALLRIAREVRDGKW